MTTLAETVDAVIGTGTHRDSHEAVIADPAGTPVMTMRIGNDSAGFTRCWPRSRRWYPGRGSRSASRAAAATGSAWRGRWPPPGCWCSSASSPAASSAAGRASPDPVDAHLAVLAALRLDADRLPVPRADGDREALRILLVARQEITVACTAQTSRLRALLLAGDDTGRRAARTTLSGTSPIPASSGMTVRHRLNRGGDRALNRAIHAIALVRMRSCPRTRAYVARRTAEGKTTREIRRCLKRYIARELYRHLTRSMNPPVGP
jgi:transposase